MQRFFTSSFFLIAALFFEPSYAKSNVTLECQKIVKTANVVASVEFATNPETMIQRLDALQQQAEPEAWLSATALFIANPNISYETKYDIVRQQNSKLKDTDFNLIWNSVADLFEISGLKTRNLILQLIAFRGDVNQSAQTAIAEELLRDHSLTGASLYAIISQLKNISSPTLAAAMYEFTLKAPAGETPSSVSLVYSEATKRDFRLLQKMHHSLLKGLVIYALWNRSSYPRAELLALFKSLLFVDDVRKYDAFKELLNSGELNLELILEVTEKNPTLALHSVRSIVKNLDKYPDLEIFIISMLIHGDQIERSNVIGFLQNRGQLRSAAAVSFLASQRSSLIGQAAKPADHLLGKSDFQNSNTIQIDLKPTNSLDQPIIRYLLADSLLEVNDFKLSLNTVSLLEDLPKKNGIPLSDKDVLQVFQNEAWGRQFQLGTIPKAANQETSFKPRLLPATNWDKVKNSEHSMPNVGEYLEERLGPHSLSLARSGSLNVIVYSGYRESLSRSGLVSQTSAIHIPSPYVEWEIDKFIDLSTETPTLIYRIQPNYDLAVHYQSMLKQAGVKDVKTYIDDAGTKSLKADFLACANNLKNKIGESAQALIMGYDYLWKEMIQADPDWILKSFEEFESTVGSAHLRVRKVIVSHKNNPKKTREFWVVGSDRTLWGEASSHLVSAILNTQSNLKDVLFLGSAGSLGFGLSLNSMVSGDIDTNTIYNISIPGLVSDGSKKTFINNSLNVSYRSTSANKEKIDLGPNSVIDEYFLETTHGFSFSPAEQSIDFTSSLSYDGINTIDVETSHITNTVNEWNQTHSTQIKFGAGHLLTDAPASSLNVYDTSNSLSDVDPKLKQQLRQDLLRLVLKQWGPRFTDRPQSSSTKPSGLYEKWEW